MHTYLTTRVFESTNHLADDNDIVHLPIGTYKFDTYSVSYWITPTPTESQLYDYLNEHHPETIAGAPLRMIEGVDADSYEGRVAMQMAAHAMMSETRDVEARP